MAESRRVHFTTVSCAGPPSSDLTITPGSGRADETETGTGTDTVRLVLDLFESDERNFPEFSYSHLVDSQLNCCKDEGPLHKSEEEERRDDDEVAAIARRLEEKYGVKPNKKKDRIQDLIDIGYGYDEEDSFIDNSEAYDEFVPASLTTKFGGFYVNSGVLQFRQVSGSETEDFTREEKTLENTPSKKRKLSGGQDKPKKKQCKADGEMKNTMDRKSSTLSEIGQSEETKKKKKKKKGVGTLSVTSMLKKFQREKEKERQKMEKANQKAVGIMGVPTIPLSPADAAGGGGGVLTDPILSLIGSTNDHALIQAASTVDFDIDLVSLLDASEEPSSPKNSLTEMQLFQPKPNAYPVTQAQPPNTKANLQPKTQSEQIQLLSEANSPQTRLCAPLPEGLTPALEDSIRRLTAAAKTSEGESKLKFFTPEINSILLDIELQCREQGGPLRSKVYTHLSSFLPCSRETLLKRVKKLLVSHTSDTNKNESPDVEDPMQKLKEAIGKAMPEQIACYQASSQAYEQIKASRAAQELNEGKQSVKAGPEDNMEERGGKRGGPKKLFKWNEEIRECLCHVLRPKMDRFKNERKGSQELEDYLKMLLDSEVKQLWPKGWMQSGALMRESRKLLGLFTSLPVKKARSDKKQSISSASTMLELPQETDDVFFDGSNVSTSTPLGAVKKEAAGSKRMEGKKGAPMDAGSFIPVESGAPQVNAASAAAHSLLDLLADQALAQEQPFRISPELLAAAVAKYKHSIQRWSFEVDTNSPPLPPPPPQSSPVSGFPVTGVCQVIFPQLLQAADFTGHEDAGQVTVISDGSDVIIQ